MTPKQKAIDAIYNGNLVNCTKEEYNNEIRSELQRAAGKWIDQNQGMRAVLALKEVKRLDKLFEQ